jgi:hypothetical protein
LFNPSIKPKIACAIFGLFIFKRLSKQVLNALKIKKPGTLVLGFLLVTSRVEKSNFYEDLEGVEEFPINTNH